MSAPEGSEPASARPTETKGPTGVWPARHVWTLFGFLAVFLALIVAFREVLFPFLMAIFLAYLVEPVLAFASGHGRLGLRLGRGPTLIFMYAIVLVGTFFLVSCGVQRVGVTIQRTIAQIKTELDVSSAAAELSVARPAPAKISVPAGTEFVLPGVAGAPPRRFRTAFTARIDEGLLSTRVLLDPVDPTTIPADAPVGAALALAEGAKVELPKGRDTGAPVELSIRVGEIAKGVEVALDRRLVGPVVARLEQATGLSWDPSQIRTFLTEYSKEHGAELGNKVATFGQRAVFRILGSTYELILILMLTAFLVIDRKGISEFFASLPPPHVRARYEGLMAYVDRGLAGVIRGQLLICAVNGVLTWIGLQIYGIPYAVPLSLLAAVFSLIPVFGTIASSIPIVLVAFSATGVGAGVFAMVWISFIHLLEANLFNPLIMGTNAEMHPVLIIFALLAGEHTFGIWGALLAVPTASIIQSCFKYYRHEVLGIPREEPHGHGTLLRKLLGRFRRASSSPPGAPS